MQPQVDTQNSSIHFVVETLEVREGRKLKALRPDETGYFVDVPITVLGIVSRNNTFYDTNSVISQITDPKSMLNITLVDGNLFGEWGHPYLDPKKPDLNRLLNVLEKYQSHHFRKIRTAERLDNGGIVLRADLKPTGPYKDYLYEQLIDPSINSSFSLRSICSERVDRRTGIRYRTVKRLTTFDAVGAGGYAEASKRYCTGSESFQLHYDDFINSETGEYACEAIKDKDILDIFGAKDMVIKRESVGMVVPGSSSYLDHSGNKRSVVHSLLRR